jgi:hypothetical protein
MAKTVMNRQFSPPANFAPGQCTAASALVLAALVAQLSEPFVTARASGYERVQRAAVPIMMSHLPQLSHSSVEEAVAPVSLRGALDAPSLLVTNTFTIGLSAQGRPIVAHQLGAGPIWRALIGAIHGSYERNTAALMMRMLDHLLANPKEIPDEITLIIVPVANPDGYAAGSNTIVGRTNGNGVDLNRNWDYKWQSNAFFGQRPIGGGSAPFSEPESVALRDFIMDNRITEVVIYHSAYPAVFAGAGRAQSDVVTLAEHIADATGYPYRPEGMPPDQIMTGNAIDWLTANGVNAIEIELTNHSGIDWPQNLRGLRAFLNWKLPTPTDDGSPTDEGLRRRSIWPTRGSSV